MADVNVTVIVDGKAVFAAGAAGAPDGQACAVAALQLGLAHFQAIKTAAIPQTSTAPAGGAPASGAARNPTDTSL